MAPQSSEGPGATIPWPQVPLPAILNALQREPHGRSHSGAFCWQFGKPGECLQLVRCQEVQEVQETKELQEVQKVRRYRRSEDSGGTGDPGAPAASQEHQSSRGSAWGCIHVVFPMPVWMSCVPCYSQGSGYISKLEPTEHRSFPVPVPVPCVPVAVPCPAQCLMLLGLLLPFSLLLLLLPGHLLIKPELFFSFFP